MLLPEPLLEPLPVLPLALLLAQVLQPEPLRALLPVQPEPLPVQPEPLPVQMS